MAQAKLASSFTIQCSECIRYETREYQHEALQWLLAHIRRRHPALAQCVERQARKMAMSQNGNGYWDNGRSNGGYDDGWHKAHGAFRESWRRAALLAMTGEA